MYALGGKADKDLPRCGVGFGRYDGLFPVFGGRNETAQDRRQIIKIAKP
jgi:hypothetical protein